MGTEDAKSQYQNESSPTPILPFPDSTIEYQQRERKKRANKELPVVARGDRRCNLSAHHIRKSANERAEEPVPESRQKQIGEEAGQENVDDESPRHRHVRGHDHPQQKRRIENVAVHRRDVRHAAEQIRIPEREMSRCSERARRKLAEGVTGDI